MQRTHLTTGRLAEHTQHGVELEQQESSEYRLKSIEIKRGDAIDSIKFNFSDGTAWSTGHDGGKADDRVAVMTPGEYLVGITHERFVNFKCAASGVEFVTNLGRTFSYQPSMATRRKSEQMQVRATPGNEIIALKIDRGVLVGATQQPVAPDAAKTAHKHWYALALFSKNAEQVEYDHYYSWSDAKRAWQGCKLTGEGCKLLIDCMQMSAIWQSGSRETLSRCHQKAKAAGYLASRREEETTMLEAVHMLFKVLSDAKDVYMFVSVVTLLGLSFYLDLEAQILTGHVISLASKLDIDALTQNAYISASCSHLVNCESSYTNSVLVSYVLVKLLEKLLYVANVWVHHNACDYKNHQLRVKAFNHVLSQDTAFFDTHGTSEIRGAMNVHTLNNLMTWNIPYLVTLALKLVLVAYFMLSLDLTLGLLAITGMSAIKYGILDLLGNYEKSTHKIMRKLDSLNSQIVDEAFEMISTIKMFGKEQRHIDEHQQAQLRYMRNINTVVVHRCVREFLYCFSRAVVFALVLYLGLSESQRTGMSTAELTSFFLLLQQFQDLFGRLKWHYDILCREFPDIERFLTLMKTEPALASGKVTPSVQLAGTIQFNEVEFEYPSRPGEPVLKALNLAIQPNKMTAIVGDSGSGKTTMARLLLRLYDPSAGAVTIDGYDLRNLDLDYLHSQIAIVPQNPELFNMSLRDNIAYGAVGDSLEQSSVETCASLARCDFVTKFRSGLDTFAGSRGTQLSGGQKQRLAIARAAMRNAQILILDEVRTRRTWPRDSLCCFYRLQALWMLRMKNLFRWPWRM